MACENNNNTKHSASSTAGYDKDKEYEVEKIVNERTYFNTGLVEYQVKWVGWDSRDNTWEPRRKLLKKAEIVVQQWEEKKKKKLARKSKGSSNPSSSEVGQEDNTSVWTAKRLRAEETFSCSTSVASAESQTTLENADGSEVAVVPCKLIDRIRAGISEEPTNMSTIADLQNLQLQLPVEKEDLLIPVVDNTESAGPSTYTVGVNFACDLEGIAEKWKNSVIALTQREVENQIKQAEKRILEVKEMEIRKLKNLHKQLKDENARLKVDIDGLNLFMLYKKDPEESLQKKNKELEKQLIAVQAENAVLRRKNETNSFSNLKETAAEMEETLTRVAELFTSVLGYRVSNGAIQRTLPLVQTKVEENAKLVSNFRVLMANQ